MLAYELYLKLEVDKKPHESSNQTNQTDLSIRFLH